MTNNEANSTATVKTTRGSLMMKLLGVMAVLMLACCTKYYRAPQNGIEVHKTFTDTSEVLFTLSEGEIVFTNAELGDWGLVYRNDDKEKVGWTRVRWLERVDDAEEDSLSDLASAEYKAKRQAEREAEQAREDSIKVKYYYQRVYFRVTADSAEIFTHDMGTKDGRKQGHKVGALASGRLVGTDEPNREWVFGVTEDGGKRQSGYIATHNLTQVSQAENDSINDQRFVSTRGLYCKKIHPLMVWICLLIAVAAVVPLWWMKRIRPAHHFSPFPLAYFGCMVITLLSCAFLDGGRYLRWCYNLLPFTLLTIFTEPLLFTNISRKNMYRLSWLLYVLLLPACFILYADHQAGVFWETIKFYLLNALLYYIFVTQDIEKKCPYCGMYATHAHAEDSFVGKQFIKSTHEEKVKDSRVVKTKTHTDLSGNKIVTRYWSPETWKKTAVSGWVNVFAHNNRCIRCRRIFDVGLFGKNDGDQRVVESYEDRKKRI